MLEPYEMKGGMAPSRPGTSCSATNAKARQIGNAVTPPNSRDLIASTAVCVGHDVGDFGGPGSPLDGAA
jgi:hypothetical protein